jgi:hypothetical protein
MSWLNTPGLTSIAQQEVLDQAVKAEPCLASAVFFH